MNQITYAGAHGKTKKVGKIKKRGNAKIYVSPRNHEKHHSYKYNGWGITKTILKDLIKRQVDYIEIKTTLPNNKKMIYQATPKLIWKHGITDKLGGWEEQVFLPDEYWTKKEVTNK